MKNNLILVATLVIVLAFVAACCLVEPSPPVADDGCPAACERWRALGCEEGAPTPGGASCEQVCGAVAASGAPPLPVECVARAASCEAARMCEE